MQIKSNKFLKWLFFIALCLILFLIVNIDSCAQPNSKTKHWQDMEKEVSTWGDALGLGIDPGIKKMVVVLNLLNFKTQQSCEGHSNWGRPYPWVRINVMTPELNDLLNEHTKILNFITEQERKIQAKHPELTSGEAMRKELPQNQAICFQNCYLWLEQYWQWLDKNIRSLL